MQHRFWEIDALRGIAIAMMLLSNAITDLQFFNAPFAPAGALWFWFARITAFIFVFLVGVSLTLSYSRTSQQTGSPPFSKYLKRGAKIFSWGLAITAVTWIFIPSGFVVFGVLHLIGVSIPLAYFFLKEKAAYWALLLALLFIAAGIWLQGISFGFNWLLWLGFIPAGFYTVDYLPLLPWLGVVLLGLFFGNMLYPDYRRKFSLPKLSKISAVRLLGFLGRHSLFIYLLHQPIILVILALLGIIQIPLF